MEAAFSADLSEQTCLSLLKLALYNENRDDEDDEISRNNAPSAFQLVLSAFSVLLHRHTGETDLLIGSSSASAQDPLVLRVSVDPNDSFWAVVLKVQRVETEAEADAVPYETIVHALEKDKPDSLDSSRPLFRVRSTLR